MLQLQGYPRSPVGLECKLRRLPAEAHCYVISDPRAARLAFQAKARESFWSKIQSYDLARIYGAQVNDKCTLKII